MTVVAALDARFKVAVTAAVLPVPLSSMVAGVNTRVTVGGPSSSRMVRVTAGGAAAPLPPAAVAVTRTWASGSSAGLSCAVTVTVPVLTVAPAAMVSFVVLDSAKSPATAPVDATGAADTVSVTAALDLPESVAVTVETPPFSPTVEGVSASATVGRVSSSVRVRVAFDGFATPLPPAAAPETVTDLFGESTSLPFAVTVTVPALVRRPRRDGQGRRARQGEVRRDRAGPRRRGHRHRHRRARRTRQASPSPSPPRPSP